MKVNITKDNLHYIKVKNVCLLKDIIKKIKGQATQWEKIFTLDFSNKRIRYRMHKDLLQIDSKMTTI